ncbi:MAG: GNAT family acetyltransferase [Clostridia bacterium]|nr:GNAT family acetyltransferase [Clostridia bacterium]
MKIRKFEKSDTEQVVKIWEECGLLHPPNDPYQEIKNKSEFQPDLFLVGEINGVPIATIMIGYEGRRGWINSLAVLPEFRGRGHGEKLVKHALDVLKELGAPKVNLLIRPTNLKVRAFYEKLGFKFEDATLMAHRFPKEK